MDIRKRKMLCIMAAVFMFLSGICLESTKANALFVYPSVQTGDGYITSIDHVGVEEQLCTSELLGVRLDTGICQRMNRIYTQKRGMDNAFHVLYASIFSATKESCFTYSLPFPFYYPSQNVFVLNYIHKSDGKKRNESLIISCL